MILEWLFFCGVPEKVDENYPISPPMGYPYEQKISRGIGHLFGQDW